MQRSHRGLSYARRIVVLIIAGLQLSACQQKPDMPGKIEPVKRDYDGETLYRLRLTAKAAEEYKIKTEPVREVQVVRSGSKALRKVVPVAAALSDGYGNTWTFTNPESLVFVRKRLRVDYIDGDLAVLSDGPPTGTAVVTVGADKLVDNEFKENGESVIEKSATQENDDGKKSLGIATMKEDGTIRLVYRTRRTTGLAADVVIEYKPQDEDYQKILDQVGGLKVGETKSVPR